MFGGEAGADEFGGADRYVAQTAGLDRRDGQIEAGRPEYVVGAHCQNHNAHSIGVCYEGGLDIRGQPADTRTEAQKAAMRRLLEDLHRRYPKALIVGHHDLNPQKDCPCIPDVAREYADMQPK